MPRTDCNRRRACAAIAVLSLLGGLAGTARSDPGPSPPLPDELLARAASADPTIRAGAVAPLEALGTPAAVNLLIVLLSRDIDPRVRVSAALALGNGKNPDAIPALEQAAALDASADVRQGASNAARALAPFERRPKFAAGLSVLCPGCGYFYLRDPARAVAYLGSAAALLGGGLAIVYSTPVNATGGHPDGRGAPLLMALQNLWGYGIYAAYRDARLARGDAFSQNPVPREELTDLMAAPFNPRVLKSPYVWAGVPLLIGGAIGYFSLVSRFATLDGGPATRTLGDPGGVKFFGRHYGTGTGFALGEAYNVTLYDTVAAGEEALFRGAVQAGLSETSLGVWGGWAVGSAIFGAIHTFNFIYDEKGLQTAALAVPYITLTGGYLGYVFVKKNFSLLTGTAIHFWYDFALSTIDFIADPDHQPFVARFAMPF